MKNNNNRIRKKWKIQYKKKKLYYSLLQAPANLFFFYYFFDIYREPTTHMLELIQFSARERVARFGKRNEGECYSLDSRDRE